MKWFCGPAHPFNCLWLMCIPVPMYIPHQLWERKCVMEHLSTRHRNSTIPCHLLYVTRYYQTQSIFCAKCSYNSMIGCAVVLYSLFRHSSTKWYLENLRSVQFFFRSRQEFLCQVWKETVLYNQGRIISLSPQSFWPFRQKEYARKAVFCFRVNKSSYVS